MKESYYVGYDPVMKTWEVAQVIPDFPDDFMIFKVSARHEAEALKKGFSAYKTMTVAPTDDRMKVFRHLHEQVVKGDQDITGLFCVDVPDSFKKEIVKLIDDGFLIRGYEGQVVIDRNGTGWKCIMHHLNNLCPAKPVRRWENEGQALAS